MEEWRLVFIVSNRKCKCKYKGKTYSENESSAPVKAYFRKALKLCDKLAIFTPQTLSIWWKLWDTTNCV